VTATRMSVIGKVFGLIRVQVVGVLGVGELRLAFDR